MCAYIRRHNYVTVTPCSVVTYETRNKGETNWQEMCFPFTHTAFFSNNFSKLRAQMRAEQHVSVLKCWTISTNVEILLKFCNITFIHSVACLTTGPQPLPKPVLHTVWSTASSINLQYPLVSSSSSCLSCPPRLPLTSKLPSLFHSIACFRRQFPCKMWPISPSSFYCT